MDKQQMNELTVANTNAPSIYSNKVAFEEAQRMAQALATSTMVPDQYKGNIANTLVAMEMANRTGASVLMVMQNLDVINGKPSWASTFIIAAINSCGRFSPLRFRVENLGQKKIAYDEWVGPKGQRQKVKKEMIINDKSCTAYTKDANGDVLEGPEVTIEMAVHEGWYTKADSKWKTMPDLMLRYRAAAFFGRLYAPDVLMGMHTFEEVTDIGAQSIAPETASPVTILNAKLKPEEAVHQSAEATEEATIVEQESEIDDEDIV
jgi:hypothetical protein